MISSLYRRIRGSRQESATVVLPAAFCRHGHDAIHHSTPSDSRATSPLGDRTNSPYARQHRPTRTSTRPSSTAQWSPWCAMLCCSAAAVSGADTTCCCARTDEPICEHHRASADGRQAEPTPDNCDRRRDHAVAQVAYTRSVHLASAVRNIRDPALPGYLGRSRGRRRRRTC